MLFVCTHPLTTKYTLLVSESVVNTAMVARERLHTHICMLRDCSLSQVKCGRSDVASDAEQPRKKKRAN